MKVKPAFTVETKRTPSREGASGSYKPETFTFFIFGAQNKEYEEQVCKHEVRED